MLLGELHSAPVLDASWSKEKNDTPMMKKQSYVYVAAAGLNQDRIHGHRDGPTEGYIDCFVPLIDLNEVPLPSDMVPYASWWFLCW